MENPEEACDEILQGIRAELSESTKPLEFRVVESHQEGVIWRLTVEGRGDAGVGLDESLEGAKAWWADPVKGGGDVLSILPEEQQVNLRFVTGYPPEVGQKLLIYPPRYLEALEKCWSDPAWVRCCLKWLHDIQGANQFSGQCTVKPGPFARSLRQKQRHAFRLPGWDAGFLWGPPGTGKTYTLGRVLARYLVEFPKSRVLLFSTTNSAVDQALVSVDEALTELSRSDPRAEAVRKECARVGSRFIGSQYAGRPHLLRVRDERLVHRLTELEVKEPGRKHVQQYAVWQDEVEQVRRGIREQMRKAFSDARLAAMTTTRGVFSFEDLRGLCSYDLVAFDEASQVGLAHALALVPLGRKALFVGDPFQLAPIVRSQDPFARHWLGDSMFCFMEESAGSTCMLDEQSRMAEPICSVVSDVFYGGRLVVAKDCLRNGAWKRDRTLAKVALMETNHVHLEWVRANGQWSRKHGGPIRWDSAGRVVDLVSQLTAAGLDSSSVLVLVPFRAQRSLVRSQLREAGLTRIRVSTVHRSQGSECHTVIFDPVAGTSPFLGGEAGRRLLNVALSRAQARLVVLLSERDRGNLVLDRIARAMEKAITLDKAEPSRPARPQK